MNGKNFTPSSKYQTKLFVGYTLLAAAIIAGGALLSFFIMLDDPQVAVALFAVTFFGTAIFWVIAMLLSVPYFRSLKYEILDDEVIMRVGVVTHSVKHVPYRTVTNLVVKRDLLDRWFFNLGSLEIQTAGVSGQTGAEEKLVGLENIQEVYEMVASELRRYRGGMAPTQTEVEPLESGPTGDVLLDEVRQIRRLLEKD